MLISNNFLCETVAGVPTQNTGQMLALESEVLRKREKLPETFQIAKQAFMSPPMKSKHMWVLWYKIAGGKKGVVSKETASCF